MTSSGDWGTPPPGVDLDETQTGEILRSVIAFMTIGICAVAVRLVARFKTGAGFATDDYLVVLALVSKQSVLLCPSNTYSP